MTEFNAGEWSRYIKEHKNPLLVAGDGCDRIIFSGQALSAYAARVAQKLGCPIAATGNTILALQESGVDKNKVKKIWLAELFRYLQDEWAEPLVKERPDLLILIGYHPDMLDGLVSRAAPHIHIVHLGPGKLPAADLSMENIPIVKWRQNLDELVGAL